ncbi:MAG: hypothetical protein KF785_05840 [Gemmatimonadales bacterium]|nr:hypothetical protein [Gemmatimonadales bacterium]
MRALAALLILLATPVAWIAAQSVAPGQRVRLIYTHPTKADTLRTSGTLISWDTTVVLTRDIKPGAAADTVRVPAAAIALVDVSMGRKSRAGRGALYGALAGGAAGAMLGATAHEDCAAGGCYYTMPVGQAMAGGALVLGAVGALVGLIIGSLGEGDQWAIVPLPESTFRVGPTPQSSVGLTFALRW